MKTIWGFFLALPFIAPTALWPQTLAREYVRVGDRVLAIENRSPTGAISPLYQSGSGGTFTSAFSGTTSSAFWSASILFSSSGVASADACYLDYVPRSSGSGTIYLMDDGGGYGQSFATIGTNSVLSNRQCEVWLAASSESILGNGATLNLFILFNQNWSGYRYAYTNVRTADGQASGYLYQGWHQIPAPSGPAVGPMNPKFGDYAGWYGDVTANGGAYALSYVYALFNSTASSADGANSCLVMFVPGSGSGSIYLNTGGANPWSWVGPATLTSTTNPSNPVWDAVNPQCTLYTNISTFTSTGNGIYLRLALIFARRVSSILRHPAWEFTDFPPVSACRVGPAG